MRQILDGPKPKFFKVSNIQLAMKVQLVLHNSQTITVLYQIELSVSLYSLDFQMLDSRKLIGMNTRKLKMKTNLMMGDMVHEY